MVTNTIVQQREFVLVFVYLLLLLQLSSLGLLSISIQLLVMCHQMIQTRRLPSNVVMR